MQNGAVESFIGKVHHEFINQYWFMSLREVKELAERWREGYNAALPHSSLDDMLTNEFKRSLEEIINHNRIA